MKLDLHHAGITIILCAIDFGAILIEGESLNLPFVGAYFFLGREVAQAEYRYIESHGGKREECPWYCGFLPESWNLKAVLDWNIPMLIAYWWVLIVALLNLEGK